MSSSPPDKRSKRKQSLSTSSSPSAPSLSYSALILDIEGTLCPITFVHETLFPYVHANLDSFLDSHFGEESFQPILDALRKQAAEDLASDDAKLKEAPEIPAGKGKAAIDGFKTNVTWQMSWDRKGGALKTLQGEMWKVGYEAGEIKGFIYPDVPGLFKQLQGNVPIYIYSSGSILGQKLIFKHSNHGDLLPYIKGHYDTGIGSKLEKESYEKIREDIGDVGGKLLFVSDNVKGWSLFSRAVLCR